MKTFRVLATRTQNAYIEIQAVDIDEAWEEATNIKDSEWEEIGNSRWKLSDIDRIE